MSGSGEASRAWGPGSSGGGRGADGAQPEKKSFYNKQPVGAQGRRDGEEPWRSGRGGQHGGSSGSRSTPAASAESSGRSWYGKRADTDSDWRGRGDVPEAPRANGAASTAASTRSPDRHRDGRGVDAAQADVPLPEGAKRQAEGRRWGRNDAGGEQDRGSAGEPAASRQWQRPDAPTGFGGAGGASGSRGSQTGQQKDRERLAVASSSGVGGKGASRKGGKGGRGNWGEGLNRLVRISKTLTQVLRHKAPDLGVTIRPDGFCLLDDVLNLAWLRDLECREQDVEEVVRDSDKKRFELLEEGGTRYIRAAQGHSIKVVQDEQLLHRLTPEDPNLPAQCVHGTYRRYFDSIKTSGLLAGGDYGQSFRNHVHFAPFEPGDKRVISGMRYDCEVAIWINLELALTDGVPFYLSANQVILSPGIEGRIDQKYFLKATDIQTGAELPLGA